MTFLDTVTTDERDRDAYAPPAPPRYDDGAAPPAPASDPLRARMESAFDKQQQYIDRATSAMEREEELATEKTRALAPLRQKQLEFASQPLPETPQLQTAPPTPKHDRHDDENWLFAASLLGSLGGALTRRHVTNALGAFQGAMEGYAQGSRQAFDQNFKAWEAENRRVQEYNKSVLERYRSIMENRKYNTEQMSVELQMAAAQFEDQAMATAARSKNSLVIAQLYDKQAEALAKMETSQEGLKFKYDQMQQRERLEMLKIQMRSIGYGTDPGQMQALIDGIGQGRMAPIRGRAGTQIMAEVAKQYPDYSEAKYKDNMFRGTMQAHQEMAANNAAERTAAVQGANIEMISRTVRSLIPQALASSEKVDRSEFRQLNQLIQLYERNAISDPVLKRFAFDTIQVAEGWARSMNPRGQMRIDDRKIALDHISTVDGPEAYKAVLQGIDESLWREAMAVAEQRRHEPLPAPIDFSRGSGGGGGGGPSAGGDLARDAREALAAGADPAAVFKRMQEMGADPSSVFLQ